MKWDKKGRNAIERIARNIAAYKGGEENRVEVSRIALFRFCMCVKKLKTWIFSNVQQSEIQSGSWNESDNGFFPFFFHPLFFHSTKITYTHLAYTSYESYSQNIFLNNSQVSNYCQKIPQKLHKLYKTVKQY